MSDTWKERNDFANVFQNGARYRFENDFVGLKIIFLYLIALDISAKLFVLLLNFNCREMMIDVNQHKKTLLEFIFWTYMKICRDLVLSLIFEELDFLTVYFTGYVNYQEVEIAFLQCSIYNTGSLTSETYSKMKIVFKVYSLHAYK